MRCSYPGKFVVDKILGSGGFGVTYKVKDTGLNKFFAVKTLNELAKNRLDFQQLQIKFINEAIALASCRHPHIVSVYPKVFQEGELWCMVMDYIEGEDLACYLEDRGKFSEADAIELITKVGKALSYVHQQGFLHRDIKPANILLRKADLSPILIDFGLAREYTSGTIRSMTNARTECFAPIEQYQRNGNFGAWTDVYALAATLYVLVTDRLPIPSQFRVYAELPSPKQHNSNLSDRVNRAILKGMELEPQNRPQSVEEWLDLLKLEQRNYTAPNFSVKLQVFEFDTVQIDRSGEIIDREHHSVKYYAEDLSDDINLEMIEIPGGESILNLPDRGRNRANNTTYQNLVRIPSFYLAKFPITQRQWQQVAILPQIERKLQLKPSQFSGADLPVENVSWYDAREFCQRLSQATGKQYRLPSEIQWEYACRAGTITPFSCGQTITSEIANYNGRYTYADEPKGEYRKITTPVNKFPPNAFGLHDMHGNVWEWCEDDWQDNYQNSPRDGSISLPEVDIWAIVATYYFLLTGFFPRNLEDPNNMMVELLTKSAVPIRERDASIPQPLAELIDLALVDNPELHFKSAIAFKEALLNII
ncbi:MAG: SUMF1/EgtB/PvdO family nonheme iron enzyme [Pleurocapsa sp. MO_226.B13]|nr:SUMF1/EgtB/PvdO family nonheme iron enzyme [Pleurocapsa sp. MO_226.B13]